MASHRFIICPSAMQAIPFHKVLYTGSTRRTPQATSVPHALLHQWQLLQIMLLFIFYCGFVLCVADGATSLGSSLALNKTLHLNETLVSDDGQFALGFWHNELMPSDAGYNLAIWYAKVPKMTPVWMPNSSITLSSQATLSLSKDGDLQLQDSVSQGSLPVWNTLSKMVSIPTLKSYFAIKCDCQ
jgi:hypothetical protein